MIIIVTWSTGYLDRTIWTNKWSMLIAQEELVIESDGRFQDNYTDKGFEICMCDC